MIVGSQGDRKGRPYNTTKPFDAPVHGRGDRKGRPGFDIIFGGEI